MNILKAFTIYFLIICFSKLSSQVITFNDGFEGTPQKDIPPPEWYNCDAIMYNTVDTQPGSFSNNKPASEGSTYISMVTREMFAPGTFEVLWTNLKTPFLKDHCYTLNLDLSLSKDFKGSYNFDDYYFDEPCLLRLVGLNEDCSKVLDNEILWESDTLTNYNWETFEFTIRPDSMNYDKIALYPFFINENEPKNSVVFVDNLRYPLQKNVYKNDGSYFLPNWAHNITWFYYGEQIEDGNSHEIPLFLPGNYKVHYFDADSCFQIEKMKLEFDYEPINIYPNPTADNIIIKFLSPHEPYKVNFEIYDAIGKLVYKRNHLINHGNNYVNINLSTLATGTYFVRFQRYDFSKERHQEMHRIVVR